MLPFVRDFLPGCGSPETSYGSVRGTLFLPFFISSPPFLQALVDKFCRLGPIVRDEFFSAYYFFRCSSISKSASLLTDRPTTPRYFRARPPINFRNLCVLPDRVELAHFIPFTRGRRVFLGSFPTSLSDISPKFLSGTSLTPVLLVGRIQNYFPFPWPPVGFGARFFSPVIGELCPRRPQPPPSALFSEPP